MTWAEVAAYGATLPQESRTELDTLRRNERDENRSWSEFSDARGGWPWRRRFDSDEEHQEAQAEWDEVYGKHLVALRDVWDRQRAAISRALPLTVDDEPVDLLELLDQQPAAPAAPTHPTALQAGALRAATTAPSPTVAPDEGLFTLPGPDRRPAADRLGKPTKVSRTAPLAWRARAARRSARRRGQRFCVRPRP